MLSFGNISKKLCALCIPAVILLSGCSADSYDSSAMRDMTTQEIIEDMGLGINLGNTFEATGSWVGGTTVSAFERCWGSPIITEEMIKGIKDGGFGVVRLPANWSNLMSDDYTISPEFDARIHEVVDWILDNDMYVILNMHHETWIADMPTNEEECLTHYSRLWEQITESFKDYDDHLMFESLNEEGGWDSVWNQYGSSTEGKAEAFGYLNKLNQTFVDAPYDNLIPQEGERIAEYERVTPKRIIRTPSGETVVDFGQEVTGYVELRLNAKAGDRVTLLHGEVLDKHGNFYNANYRLAKARLCYICREGMQTYHPRLTFFGFRYVLLKEFPTEPEPDMFTAVAVHSDIRQTGYIETGNEDINKLISNIFWGQRSNFLDVPTDCPQRDERLGWTGDAQVFVKTASLNFDVERFFRKWLRDLAADQHPDGSVGQVIPDYMPGEPSAAWGDAAVICPWQIYMTYGDKSVLEEQFDSMKGWVDYITSVTADEGLWTGGTHFGDWLGLDAPSGSYKGSSRDDFIASAFYYYSTCLLVKAGKIIGKDMSDYERLAEQIKTRFRTAFPGCYTQTEHVLAIRFGLAENIGKCAAELAQMIEDAGMQMTTGFVGTPYLLHALSDNGYAAHAYSLLLRKEYPSWLYSVGKGATTIWEHWDGIMENGDFWSTDMNSFNHYAYGSVADWIYEKAAGIKAVEGEPGYRKVIIAPTPDRRLGWLRVRLDTRNGKIVSYWRCEENNVRYEISVDMPAEIIIDGRTENVAPGRYIFWGKGAEKY